ncbi:MAG: carbamoyl-phosphate synthase large subunit [Cellvibrionaceae bacterium]|jgi:carbamoyl-phosphate synthase large subunit
MPKRTDINTILIIGSGPIIIGQGCEFDYSGVQACKALRDEGYRTVLVNSNPATIMTDPNMADATYIEPLTVEMVEKIIIKEKPDVILGTVGGQTGLNLALDLAKAGVLEKHNVQLIGAQVRSIEVAENRILFQEEMRKAGIPVPGGHFVKSMEEAWAAAEDTGFPALIRASYTLGGSGGGVAWSKDDFVKVVENGLRASPVGEILVERSLIGWKEYELEVMRDSANNFVVVCSIENIDAMGVHTGDSATVAPAQTLTDREYQYLRDMAKKVMEVVGVETGGSNVQFAVNHATGEVLTIEMNPRVSRSSALASKATGFPIAKIAALLAVGYTLDEVSNDITRVTPASFEPSIDYTVVKIPRWNFEKFSGSDPVLGPQMKSIGEVMAIGRTFPEAFNKAMRGLEVGWAGFSRLLVDPEAGPITPDQLIIPTAERLAYVAGALLQGMTVEAVSEATGFDMWYTTQMQMILDAEGELVGRNLADLNRHDFLHVKKMGISDKMIANAVGSNELSVRAARKALDVKAAYYRVDTCAAEFEAHTPYLYSTYERHDEANPTDKEKVIILGGGPNRIGQGIEFDYCCVHACWALSDLGYETIMVNCNPETVSTDYDTADRLYFEPLTFEDVMNIIDLEKPVGVIVQFGGQTPINLTTALAEAGAPIWGTPPASIDLAEDRGEFGELLQRLEIDHPRWGITTNRDEALKIAYEVGFPVLVRPSFVLGGRAMAIAHDSESLLRYFDDAVAVDTGHHENFVLIDQFIEDAYEVDVDAVCDGERVVIAGVMQHIEEAGIHSGDSACVLPPYKISPYHIDIMSDYATRLGNALNVRGLMNIQFAIRDDAVYVIEVNPRASRTVPYVSKATGRPIARIAAQVQAGKTLEELDFTRTPVVDGFFIKEVVLPFNKLPGADTRLGPEMKSTGEVMGHARRFGHAFVKAQLAAGTNLPVDGGVLITVNDFDKSAAIRMARTLKNFGFTIYATRGTAAAMEKAGVSVLVAPKAGEHEINAVTMIANGTVGMVINTPLGQGTYEDQDAMRSAAIRHNVPLLSTLSAASAAINGIKMLRSHELRVRSLQEHHGM